jgi:Immunoglobulin domain
VRTDTCTETCPPMITGPPTNQIVSVGATLTFRVTASGNNLVYEWRFNETIMANGNTATLTLPNVTTNQSGRLLGRGQQQSWRHCPRRRATPDRARTGAGHGADLGAPGAGGHADYLVLRGGGGIPFHIGIKRHFEAWQLGHPNPNQLSCVHCRIQDESSSECQNGAETLLPGPRQRELKLGFCRYCGLMATR